MTGAIRMVCRLPVNTRERRAYLKLRKITRRRPSSVLRAVDELERIGANNMQTFAVLIGLGIPPQLCAPVAAALGYGFSVD